MGNEIQRWIGVALEVMQWQAAEPEDEAPKSTFQLSPIAQSAG